MNDPAVLHMLASYLPRLVVERLQRADALGVPDVERRQGVVLFADVDGFTAMAERLAQQGPVGAEQLSRLLNDYFGRAIRRINSAGGDVVRFAGDAILAVWTAADDVALRDMVRCVARCGMALQAELRDFCGTDGTPLTLKMGLGWGDFSVMYLGGEFARHEFLVTGPAFEQAFGAVEHAAAGEVVVASTCQSMLPEDWVERATAGGVVLRQSTPPATANAVAPVESADGDPAAVDRSDVHRQIRSYISGTVTSQIENDQQEWIAALRVVSVLFANLPDLNHDTPIDRAQAIFLILQQELYRYEGTINKLNVDDKGTSLLAAMGLPPLAHEDDARRAVVAAMAIHDRLRAEGYRSSIGVATGRVFCGSMGNDRRREYTILGDVVNLSARLMQAAGGGIYCDTATYEATRQQVEFERLADATLKGKSQPVAAYRPVMRKDSTITAVRQLVGRVGEQNTLRAAVAELVRKHREQDFQEASTIVIEGEPGIGKSALVSELLTLANQAEVRCLVGSGDSIETTTLYHAWKPIILRALGLATDPTERRRREEQIVSRLQDDPELARLAPLLNPILSVDIADNDITRHMSGRVRGENTRSLVRRLIADALRERPTLVVVEDIHWLDSASWSLVEDMARDTPWFLLVLTGRPEIRTAPQYQAVLRAGHTRWLSLGRFTREDTGRLLAQCMKVDSVSPSVVDMVYEKAGGNPLFSEQLAVVVRDLYRAHQAEGNPIKFESGLHATMLDFPDTLHGAITGTIDRLEPPAQLAIKVASVIGRRFSYQALHDNYPVARLRPRVRDFIGSGMHANLVEVMVPDPPVRYSFRHALMQQVAYDLLLFKQRRELHRSLAQWYEANEGFQLENRPAVLAHHWKQAGVASKAQKYAQQAADNAYRNGAYAEAAQHFQTVLRLDRDAGQPASRIQRAMWERRLGESLLGMGNLADSRIHLQYALADVDRPAPESKFFLALSVFAQAGIQLVRRLTPRALRSMRVRWAGQSPYREPFLEAACTYERLGEVFYLGNQRERLVHAVLSSLNLAERAGPSAQLARAYANNCFAAGLGGLHRLARSYARDAWAAADEEQHPDAAAWVAEVIGVYQLGIGQLDEARRAFAQAIAINERLGDWPHWGENMAATAQACYFHGEIQLGKRTWQQLYERAKERRDPLQMAWGLNGRAEAILRTSDAVHCDEAVGILEEAVRLLEHNVDRVSRIGSFGLLSTAHLRCGHPAEAAEAANAGLRLSDEITNPTGYYSLNGYAHVAETYLALWAIGFGDADASMQKMALRACCALERYAATFPLGRPSALVCRGQYWWLMGKPRRAHAAWRKCLKIAAGMQMPHPQATAAWRLGSSLAEDHPERAQHLAFAIETFRKLGAQFELGRLGEVEVGDEGLEPPTSTV